jgi:hypothetical protein
VPAAVWAGAALDTTISDCDYDCGERGRGWFAYVLVTAPLIPLGAWLAAAGLRRPGFLSRLGRLACALVAGVFALMGLVIGLAATGMTGEDTSAVMYLIVAGFCFAIAFLVLDVRRRLPRT